MSLLNRVNGINKWIEENPNVTDPNMYEIMDCTIELGKLSAEAKVGDMPNKYPPEGELRDTRVAVSKMVNSRLSHETLKDNNSLVHYGSPLYDLFSEVNMRCLLGEYNNPQGIAGENKKELLCKLSGIGLFIEQQKRSISKGEDIDKIYNNEDEFSRLKSLYEDYMSQEHPQSDRQIKGMFESIEKEYNLSKEEKRKR